MIFTQLFLEMGKVVCPQSTPKCILWIGFPNLTNHNQLDKLHPIVGEKEDFKRFCLMCLMPLMMLVCHVKGKEKKNAKGTWEKNGKKIIKYHYVNLFSNVFAMFCQNNLHLQFLVYFCQDLFFFQVYFSLRKFSRISFSVTKFCKFSLIKFNQI
jgi:hypothetical protein